MTPLYQELGSHWHPQRERCGLILRSGQTHELPNISPSPDVAFEMAIPDDLLPEVIATWHTHASGVGSNLSVPDYLLYLQHPQLWHYIVGGPADIRAYFVEDGVVLQYEEDSHPA